MARLLKDGSIQMRDGRILWGRDQLQIIDLIELQELLLPPAHAGAGFISGGGGGRGADGKPGAAGLPGPVGPPGPGALIDFTYYVSAGHGSDATGDGSISSPYKTIAFAVAAIPAHGNSYSVWANERWTIHLEPGRYAEAGPIILRQVRRSIRLYGDGAVIDNEVRFVQNIADWPDGVLFSPALVPAPWGPPDNTFPLVTFEIAGESGGMEGGITANNIILRGRVLYRAEGSGPALATVGPTFWFGRSFQSMAGWEYENGTAPVGAPSVTVELEQFSILNRHIGGDGVGGAVFSLKAHNGQLRGTIGPFCTILEIDSCRVSAVDRLTDFSGGAAAGSVVSSVTTGQVHIHDCAFNGGTYNFGQAAPGGILIMDEVSLRRLLAQPGVTFTNVVARIHDILSGPAAARPTALVERGTRYYDTSLNVPIWREPAAGTGWVNGVGAAV
jgi:hypothetical protein